MNINIDILPAEDILEKDGKELNTYNHWNHNKKPLDYDDVISRNDTKNWVNLFHKSYKVFYLDKEDLGWMYQAFVIGRQTQIFPTLYKEELRDLLDKYKDLELFDGTKYFVRTERVSLKYGVYGAGPYTNLRDIIESMVTTIDNHKCFTKDDNICKVYLFPWIEIDRNKEFRIFVYNSHITAISQQNIYNSNNWLYDKNKNYIINIIKKILGFFDTRIKPIYNNSNYVLDLALVGEDNTPYFIEPNCFGKEYASGSALFHWINDSSILYNKIPNNIHFRYTK